MSRRCAWIAAATLVVGCLATLPSLTKSHGIADSLVAWPTPKAQLPRTDHPMASGSYLRPT